MTVEQLRKIMADLPDDAEVEHASDVEEVEFVTFVASYRIFADGKRSGVYKDSREASERFVARNYAGKTTELRPVLLVEVR